MTDFDIFSLLECRKRRTRSHGTRKTVFLALRAPTKVTGDVSSENDVFIHRRIHHNICRNPLHGDSQVLGPRAATATRQRQSASDARRVRVKIGIEIQELQNRRDEMASSLCNHYRQRLDNRTIDEYVTMDSLSQVDSVAAAYIRVYQLAMLFRVPGERASVECCLSTREIKRRITNRILYSFFRLVRHSDSNITLPACIQTVHLTDSLHVPHRDESSCQVLRDYIYVALRYSIGVLEDTKDLLRGII